ncbi:NfeD family protein [Nocardioides marmoraquaticus]
MEWWQDLTDWLGDNAWAGWVALAAVLGGLEMIGTDLWLVMLAGGALGGAVAAGLNAPFLLQLGLFTITSVALMALVRPSVVKRIHTAPTLRTGHQNLIGQRGTVVVAIEGAGPGRVKVDGQEWSARSYDEDDSIEVGARVDVVMIEGATAFVLRTHTLEA